MQHASQLQPSYSTTFWNVTREFSHFGAFRTGLET